MDNSPSELDHASLNQAVERQRLRLKPWASAEKNSGGEQKYSRDGHLSESYSQVSVSDWVTN